MTTPCKRCPFRNDIEPYLPGERVEEIINAITCMDQTFTCHETTVEDDEGELQTTSDSQHCAGALIFLEKGEGNPNQMMRIAERLQMYDRHKLNMDAPVYEGEEEMVDAAYEC